MEARALSHMLEVQVAPPDLAGKQSCGHSLQDCTQRQLCIFRCMNTSSMAWQAIKYLCTAAMVPMTAHASPDPVSFWQIVQWQRT